MRSLQFSKSAPVGLLLLGWLAATALGQESLVTCPAGFTVVGDNCYHASSIVTPGRTASSYCSVQGGTLALISSYQEVEHLRKSDIIESRTYLIDSNIMGFASDRSYLESTATGSIGADLTLPSDVRADDCVALDGAFHLRWRRVGCATKHTVLCQAPAHHKPTPAPEKLTCGAGTSLFERSCLWANISQAYTFEQAQQECAARGMSIPSVHSQEENDFIMGLAEASHVWIAMKKVSPGVHHWLDLTPLDFENWGTLEPSGTKGYDCVDMDWTTGKWRECGCDLTFGVVCRGEAQPEA